MNGYSFRLNSNDTDEESFSISLINEIKRILQDEKIDCIIFSTFSLDLVYFMDHFIQLFDSANKEIPILLLHGDRGLNKQGESFVNNKKKNIKIHQVSPNIHFFEAGNRKHIPLKGVHHPKYILIFTQMGLYVFITTANLTRSNENLDITWTQYFKKVKPNISPKIFNNDFGYYLEDFLIKQSLQINLDSKNFSILDWIKEHSGVNKLCAEFDFQSSKADLVSVVPGRYPMPDLDETEEKWLYSHFNVDPDQKMSKSCQDCLINDSTINSSNYENHTIKYGLKRLKYLLSIYENLLPRKLTLDDKVFVQPTSIGSSIDNYFIAKFLNHVIPEANNSIGAISDSWHLIWPTLNFVENSWKSKRKTLGSNFHNRTLKKAMLDFSIGKNQFNLTHPNNEVIEDFLEPNETDEPEDRNGLLFFHPKSFAQMEQDILSRFLKYKPSSVDFLGIHNLSVKIPHVKSYARVLKPNLEYDQKCDDNCKCSDIAWFLLTSACLSRGAQGEEIPYSICPVCKNIKKGYVEYRNFELGVLFHSAPTRRFRSPSKDCPIHQNHIEASSNDQICLPIPFELKNLYSYCDENGRFEELPFLHEIQNAKKFNIFSKKRFFANHVEESKKEDSKVNLISGKGQVVWSQNIFNFDSPKGTIKPERKIETASNNVELDTYNVKKEPIENLSDYLFI